MIKKVLAPVDAKIIRMIKLVKPYEGDEYHVPNLPYNKSVVDSFGTMIRKNDKITNITWEGCRDRFQNTSEPEAYVDFLFCCKEEAATHIIDFIHTVEQLLKLPPESCLTIRRTSSPTIIYVKFSPWWKYKLRRSLLTALLRCGPYYTERTAKCFKQALYSKYYLKQTKAAVEQFILKGRTASKLKRKMGFSGWFNQFSGKKDEDVRKVLTRLKPTPVDAVVDAGEAKPVAEVKQEE